MPQLALRYDGQAQAEVDWTRLRDLLREVVDFVGVKQVAFDLDIAPSSLVQALNGHDRHHVRLAWLPYLVRKAPNAAVLEFLAELRGLEVQPAKPLTPEEELAALKEALDESLGPELRTAVLAKARKKAQR